MPDTIANVVSDALVIQSLEIRRAGRHKEGFNSLVVFLCPPLVIGFGVFIHETPHYAKFFSLVRGEGADKHCGPEPHNGLLYCYEATNITGEKVVNRYKTYLNDALI